MKRLPPSHQLPTQSATIMQQCSVEGQESDVISLKSALEATLSCYRLFLATLGLLSKILYVWLLKDHGGLSKLSYTQSTGPIHVPSVHYLKTLSTLKRMEASNNQVPLTYIFSRFTHPVRGVLSSSNAHLCLLTGPLLDPRYLPPSSLLLSQMLWKYHHQSTWRLST